MRHIDFTASMDDIYAELRSRPVDKQALADQAGKRFMALEQRDASSPATKRAFAEWRRLVAEADER